MSISSSRRLQTHSFLSKTHSFLSKNAFFSVFVQKFITMQELGKYHELHDDLDKNEFRLFNCVSNTDLITRVTNLSRSADAVLQCGAVWCSVVQCCAVRCHMSQCDVVWCSMLQCVVVCCSVLQCVAVCCSVLQSVAVCYSVLQCVTVCYSVLQCVLKPSTVYYSVS